MDVLPAGSTSLREHGIGYSMGLAFNRPRLLKDSSRSFAVGNNNISRRTDRPTRNSDHAYRCVGRQPHCFNRDGADCIGHSDHCAALQCSQGTECEGAIFHAVTKDANVMLVIFHG
jgi:hypothetical protein